MIGRNILWLACAAVLLPPAFGYAQGTPAPYVGDRARFADTLATAKTAVKRDGDIVTTKGRETAGDGGGATYIYRATGRGGLSATSDEEGGFYVDGPDPGGDDYFELVDKSVANVIQFGADPTGTDDSTDAIQMAIDAMADQGGGTVFFPPGDYDYTRLVIKSYVTLEGASTTGSYLMCRDNSLDDIRTDTVTFSGANISVSNTALNGSAESCAFDESTDYITTSRDLYLQVGDRIQLTNTGGAVPAELAEATSYFVVAKSGEDSVRISATRGGSYIDFTDNGTGTNTLNTVVYDYDYGDRVQFRTTNALPGELTAATRYFVVSANATTITVSATSGGSAITTTSGGTGTHHIGIAIGSSIRTSDADVAVARAGFKNISIATARSSVGGAQDTYDTLCGINLTACNRTQIDNVVFAGMGGGAIIFARAEAGAEGLGFSTSLDGNYNDVRNVNLSAVGDYNKAKAAIWLKYKANSNKFFNITSSAVGTTVGITHGNANSFYGGTSESADRVFSFGANAKDNLVSGFRGEVISGNAFDFEDGSEGNVVLGGHLTGVSGTAYLDVSGENRYVQGEVNDFRNRAEFPPTASVATYHNHGIMEVVGLQGDSDWPLWVKSVVYNDSTKIPEIRFWSTVLTSVADDVLGRISFRTQDAGNVGVAASIDAVVEDGDGNAGLSFRTGDESDIAEALRIGSDASLKVYGRTETFGRVKTGGNNVNAQKLLTSAFMHLDAAKGLYSDDGSTVAVDTDDIEQWVDSNGVMVEQTTSSAQPTLVTNAFNNMPALYFDGDDYLQSTLPAASWSFMHDGTGGTVFTVYYEDDADPNTLSTILATNDWTASRGFTLGSDDRASQSRDDRHLFIVGNGSGTVANIVSANDALEAQEWQIVGAKVADETYVFGKEYEASVAFSATPSTSAPTSTLRIGRVSGSGSFYLDGYVAEVIIFDYALTTAEIELVNNHLKEKYQQLTLASSGIHVEDRGTDPEDPPAGHHTLWQSDGTGSGDDGDIMVTITDSGGTTKTITLVDYSAF